MGHGQKDGRMVLALRIHCALNGVVEGRHGALPLGGMLEQQCLSQGAERCAKASLAFSSPAKRFLPTRHTRRNAVESAGSHLKQTAPALGA